MQKIEISRKLLNSEGFPHRSMVCGQSCGQKSDNARSVIPHNHEAKALGIKMGDPEFKIRELIKREKIKVFSSNYALYGSLSGRVAAGESKTALAQELGISRQ